MLGLGSVGGRLARTLAAAGARLFDVDVDPGRRRLAEQVGARWVDGDALLTTELDVLVPAAVAGPANDQLADDDVAALLHDRGVLWAPGYLVSAGGVVNGVAREVDGDAPATAAARVRGIGTTLRGVLREAADTGTTPHAVATARARALLHGRATARARRERVS